MKLPDAPDPLAGTVLPPLPRIHVRNLALEEAPAEDELDVLGVEGREMCGVFSDAPFLYPYFERLRP